MVLTPQKDSAEKAGKVTGSIAHAAEILYCLSDGIHKISDIARQTGFSKSTVHRVLKLMEQSQLAVQDTFARSYYLGPLIGSLGASSIATHKRLVTCADAEMRRLSSISEETVVLDIMMGFKFIEIYEVPSQHNLRVSEGRGRYSNMYPDLFAGASIRALMAQLDDARLKILLKIITITPVTARTLTDKKLLLAHVMETKRLGYTVSRGERIPGVISIAVPVHGYILPVGLSVVGPDIRLQSKVKGVIQELKASSVKISRNIAMMFGERK